MKRSLYQFCTLLFVICIFCFSTKAQKISSVLDTIDLAQWENISQFGVRFSLPEIPLTFDTLRNNVWANNIDAQLALQVHIFSEPDFGQTPIAFAEALRKENSDTLRAIADLMLLITNSESTEVIEVQNNGVDGLQLGMHYLTMATEVPYHTFIQYYLRDNYFYAFTVTIAENDLERGITYRNRLFDSIQFY